MTYVGRIMVKIASTNLNDAELMTPNFFFSICTVIWQYGFCGGKMLCCHGFVLLVCTEHACRYIRWYNVKSFAYYDKNGEKWIFINIKIWLYFFLTHRVWHWSASKTQSIAFLFSDIMKWTSFSVLNNWKFAIVTD